MNVIIDPEAWFVFHPNTGAPANYDSSELLMRVFSLNNQQLKSIFANGTLDLDDGYIQLNGEI